MTDYILAPDYLLPTSNPETLIKDMAVAVTGGKILAIDNCDVLANRYPLLQVRRLEGCILMAGFTNAHQHGRGISQIQMGYPDDFLEPWIASRRARGVLDSYATARFAALRMAANGVTTAIHANYTFGSGDYGSEVRAQIKAYRDVGIRITMCVGAMDQGTIAYPPHEACFCAGLTDEVRNWVSANGANAYAGDGEQTIDLMDQLLVEYGDDSGVRLFYGPAGPQWVSDKLWQQLSEDAQKKGLGIHFHGMESAAQRAATQELFPGGTYKHLEQLGALSPNTTIAHAVQVTDEDIDVIARNNCIVVRNPACNLRVGSGIQPMGKFIEKGVRVAIGTDNISLRDDEDILGELRLADLLARPFDWNMRAGPTTENLLKMITEHGADAAGIGDVAGRITVGQSADMTAISLESTLKPYLDPDMPLLMAFMTRATGLDVRMTMVEGNIVFENGKFPELDADEIERSAVETAISARRPKENSQASVENTNELINALRRHYQDRVRVAETRSGAGNES